MSRTTLCVITATVLIVLTLTTAIWRYQALGDEVKLPSGPGIWKVTMTVQGQSLGEARLVTTPPLDCQHQHVLREIFRSSQFSEHIPETRTPDRRKVFWTPRPGSGAGPFKLRCEYYCDLSVSEPTASMAEMTRKLYAAPAPGTYLEVTGDGNDNAKLAALARELTRNTRSLTDQAHALFAYVDKEIANEATVGLNSIGATECLRDTSGDSGGKARLLVALLRNRGIPARMVVGVSLGKGREQVAHYWVEAWLHERWLPMCPFNHHYGKVPATYVTFALGDVALVRGRNVRDLDYAFLIERMPEPRPAGEAMTPARRFFRAVSFYMLPPAEQRLVEFLLLVPVAALIVCIFRNLIGLNSFGTFAPALIGLAFRDLRSWPGVMVFVSILLVGWLFRRVVDHYHLLQVPRIAVMVSVIVLLLITAIVGANFRAMPATRYISLFPIIILTGMIERFWTLETEDGTTSSFKTLLNTFFITAVIALTLNIPGLMRLLFRYPELLGLIIAIQLLIGRYTGYRLMELFRFRDFLKLSPAAGQ